ncbi:MAG: hypothetical protein PUG44_03245 [Streptococcus hyointestinalis]|nr:hypothetical protein [Streptococcus hyointestinalis]MDD7356057.1 hypothetical protein [Streptococcus hyointestinalis]
MDFFSNILTFIITFIAPIIQTVLQVIEFIDNRKNKNNPNVIHNGDSYHYEQNVNINSDNALSSVKIQNIEYIRKFISKTHFVLVLILFIFNICLSWSQLPNGSVLKGGHFNILDNGISTVVKEFMNVFADSFIATMLPMIALMMSFLSVLLLKQIFEFRLTKVIPILYFSLTIFCYFQLYLNLNNFDLTTITIEISLFNLTIDYSPFISNLALIIGALFVGVSLKLIDIMFETKETQKKFLPSEIFSS